MKNRTSRLIETLESIHSASTHPKDKMDLLDQLSEIQKELSESDIEKLKQSKNPVVVDWLKIRI